MPENRVMDQSINAGSSKLKVATTNVGSNIEEHRNRNNNNKSDKSVTKPNENKTKRI